MAGCGAFSDLTGADPVSPIPDVEGQWRGTFTTTACTVSSAALQGFCAVVFSTDPVPFVLALAQFEDELVGSFQLGDALVPMSGTIDEAGRIRLSGSASAVFGGAGTMTLTLLDWDTTASGASLTGGWSSEIEASDTGDTTQATHVIVEATKTS